MGITPTSLNFALDAIERAGLKLNRLRMVELGNQHFYWTDEITYKVAKDYFESLGVMHASIDINGEDGALPLDLSKEILFQREWFDVLTNFGTSEHVSNQYECWRNTHNLVRVGGLFIHVLPKIGYFKDHSEYHYNYIFFQALAQMCGYTILSPPALIGIDHTQVYVAMVKKEDVPFISRVAFSGLTIDYQKFSRIALVKQSNVYQWFNYNYVLAKHTAGKMMRKVLK